MFLVSSPRHRCYAGDRSERIGATYQSVICLTSAYRRCPRLLEAAGAETRAPEPAMSDGHPQEPVSRVGQTVRHTDLRSLRAAKRPSPRRSVSLIELVVLGLAVSIALAAVFIGYALVHRLRVGPGMGVAPAVAGGPELVPSLVPTIAPTVSPTPASSAGTLDPPTPIPEPTLPMSEPITRLPATSPPTRLVIPKIDLDIPVRPVGIKTIQEGGQPKTVWADVPNAGGFHQTSAYPGNPGNTVINGHRDILGAVFRRLDRLAVGNEIVLYVGEVAYPYLVAETLIVPETFASAQQRTENLRLIGYVPEERLTLVTCTPIGLATHRLLVIAKPPG
jgi:sortase A